MMFKDHTPTQLGILEEMTPFDILQYVLEYEHVHRILVVVCIYVCLHDVREHHMYDVVNSHLSWMSIRTTTRVHV